MPNNKYPLLLLSPTLHPGSYKKWADAKSASKLLAIIGFTPQTDVKDAKEEAAEGEAAVEESAGVEATDVVESAEGEAAEEEAAEVESTEEEAAN